MPAAVAALLIGLVCAAFGLAAWGGIRWPALDWLTHFAPVGLAGSVVAALLWWASRRKARRVAAPIIVVGLLAWGGLVVPELVGAVFAERNAKGAETLRIVQFNLWSGDPGSARKIAWLRSTNADVIVMEEVGDPAKPILAALQTTYPYKFTCEKQPYPCPVTVLSKHRPVAEGYFSGVGPHQANTAWARFAGAGGTYEIVAVHFDRAPPHQRQKVQYATLTRQLRGFDVENTVLAGDFNATPWSFILRRFDRESGLIRRTRALATWPAERFSGRRIPAPFALTPIDHIYAGKAWRTVSVKRGPRLGSDHYPIVVDLTRG